MTATYREAVDAMFALFFTAWNTNTAAIVGTVPAIEWQGVESAEKPAVDSYWCMASVQNVLERQDTFKSGVAPSEGRRYTSTGFVIIQLFCPRVKADAMDKGRQLAEVARDAFRGKTTVNGILFRNARINELPPEENSYRFNVVVEYEFDDIG